jgi:hypothetical protein
MFFKKGGVIMRFSKVLFFLLSTLLLTNSLIAAETVSEKPRTLDRQCRYTVHTDGSELTYREHLNKMLALYNEHSKDDEKSKVVHSIQQVIELFGTGPRTHSESEIDFKVGNYTTFKSYKDQFLKVITQGEFPFPFGKSKEAKLEEANAKEAGESYDLTYFDIKHSLHGILQHHAHRFTGGDS